MNVSYTQSNIAAALQVFQGAPDKEAIDTANAFLSDFQHSTDAWAICNDMLLASNVSTPARLFAAQTFRTKVTYDLSQLDQSQSFSLKDTLLTALEHYQSGPRTIQVQLCLAISGLALQLPLWTNSVKTILQKFSTDPATVPMLLEFLRVLPEEITGNTKIPISNESYRAMAPLLLTDNAKEVLELLVMYIQAQGVSTDIQNQIFECLRSWIVAGEILASDVAQTPFLDFSFDALASDSLFDSAVDLVCDIIHETQEVYDNEEVIGLIMPRLTGLRAQLGAAQSDSEKARGYTRIFTEAGENYRQLIIQHPETFFPIVEAIVECTAYQDLDVVPITFHFWYRLAQSLGKSNNVSPLFSQAYRALLGIIIQHLHFPQDEGSLSGQEADDFRSFRHVMGDTLKDCCYILGSDACLTSAYDMISVAVSQQNGHAPVSWQTVEAPLFAMRSMGAEVDVHDDQTVPKIMDLIPTLPTHPRIRYAAMLVVSRYTEWINMHPAYIPFQLTYLSAGFESPDSELSAAAAQAMKYLCKDCKKVKHLVDALPQLHTFINTMGPRMSQDDRIQIYEAIGHIITYLPMERAAATLRTFSFHILEKVHAITARPSPASVDDLKLIADYLEQLEALLRIIDTFGEVLPDSCKTAHTEAWTLFDPLLRSYGSTYFITERVTRLLRHGLQFFGQSALSAVPSVLACLTSSFEETGYSSCMWIAGKFVQNFGQSKDSGIRSVISSMYGGMSSTVRRLLQNAGPSDLPDVVEDYLQLSQAMLDYAPESFFASSGFEITFMTCLAALTMIHTDIVFASLDLLRLLLSHESLTKPGVAAASPDQLLCSSRIREVFEAHGYQLVVSLLNGITGAFPEESASAVVLLFRCIAETWPKELSTWLPGTLQALPPASSSISAKSKFLQECNSAIEQRQPDKVKSAVTFLFRESRKLRERRDLRVGR